MYGQDLHHLRCMSPYEIWDSLHVNWGMYSIYNKCPRQQIQCAKNSIREISCAYHDQILLGGG